jgi:hypothetical protein
MRWSLIILGVSSLRPATSKLAKAAQVINTLRVHSPVTKMDSNLGGTLPRHFDILQAKQPPGAFDLMTESYLVSVATNSQQTHKATEFPPVRSESSAGTARVQKVSLADSISSISNVKYMSKKIHQLSSSLSLPSPNSALNVEMSQDRYLNQPVRDKVFIEICCSSGMEAGVMDSTGDTLTSMILQVPKSFRENSVKAMQLKTYQHESAEAKLIADNHISQPVSASPKISGTKVSFPSDFLKPFDFGAEPMHQQELDEPTILLLHGPGIALTDEISLPDGCTVIQKQRYDGKNEIRLNFSNSPVDRSDAKRSMAWFLDQWKKLENFDSDCSLSNVQTAWTLLSVSFMDVARQNFMICKERGVHLQHLWVHLSTFACRGITLAQQVACHFAESEVKYLQKISNFETNFTFEVDKLHKFYQKQLNLAWNTEERYKLIIMGLEKDKSDLIAQLSKVHESAIYNELTALRTFYINFAENTKFLRDLVIDATSDWSKRTSNVDQRWKATALGQVESVEKVALTIGQNDQEDWEQKLNEIFASKEQNNREVISLKESNALLMNEVSNLREELEKYYSCCKLILLSYTYSYLGLKIYSSNLNW